MNRKKLYAISFSIVIIACLWAFIWSYIVTKGVRDDLQTGAGEDQRLDVDGLVITETKDEEIYWEIYAEKGSYKSEKGLVILANVMGNFYKEGEVELSFESSKGTYDEKTRIITLHEDTFIMAKDGASIRADKMTWRGRDENIVAEGNVRVDRNDRVVAKSERAVFNNDLTYFRIEGNSKLEIFEGGETTE